MFKNLVIVVLLMSTVGLAVLYLNAEAALKTQPSQREAQVPATQPKPVALANTGQSLPVAPPAPRREDTAEVEAFLKNARRLDVAVNNGITVQGLADAIVELTASGEEAVASTNDPFLRDGIESYTRMASDTLWYWRLKNVSSDDDGSMPIPYDNGKISWAAYETQMSDILKGPNLENFAGFIKRYNLQSCLWADRPSRLGVTFNGTYALKLLLTQLDIEFRLLEAHAKSINTSTQAN